MFVHLNCACTLDGCIGLPGPRPLSISNEEDRRRVHGLRSQCDAILVGVGTVLADDPKLTVKWELVGPKGNEPLRVVLDSRLRTPEGAHVRDRSARTIFFTVEGSAPAPPGADVERVGQAPEGHLDLVQVLDRLSRRGVRRLLVEGGSQALTSFFRGNLVDVATIFISPQVLGHPEAPRLTAEAWDLRRHLRLQSAAPLGDGTLLTFSR